MSKKLLKNWVETSLLSVANLSTGKRDANHAVTDGIFPFYTCALTQSRSSTYAFEGPSVIVPGNGNIGYVFYYDGKFEAYQRTYILNEIRIYPKYLFYHFKYYWKKRTVDNLFGSTIQYVKIGNFKNYQVTFPPLPEQHRIVTKLDTLFAELETIKKKMENIPTLIKQFKQAVLTQAVTGKLTEEWRKGKELSEWSVIEIDEIITSIEAGKNFRCPEYPVSKGNVGLVKISAVTWDVFDPAETKTVIDPEKINQDYFIKEGDFLISRANTLELVGASVIVSEIDYDIMISDKVWRVNFINNTNKWYIHRFLKSLQGRKEIESRATGNQLSMRNLSQKNFKAISVPWPSDLEQSVILKRIESLFSKVNTIEKHYDLLKTKIDNLPQTILEKAFKGELVEQLDSDGDARELLEEIKRLKVEMKGNVTKKKRNTKTTFKTRKELKKLLQQKLKEILQQNINGLSYNRLLKEIGDKTNEELVEILIKEMLADKNISQEFDSEVKQMVLKLNI